MKLGLREANQHFSKAIQAVRAGKEVILTDRGHPIAVITPIRAEKGEAATQAMANEGLITLASRKGPMPPPRWRPAKIKGDSLAQTIIDDREEHA